MSQLGYQALGRQRFEVYNSRPDLISVAGTYHGSNSGYFGYMGGLHYLYFTPVVGGIELRIRNYASDQYGSSPASGVFEFDYQKGLFAGNISLVQGDGLTPDPTKGVFIQSNFPDHVLLKPYVVIAAVAQPYTLSATEAIHVEFFVRRYMLEARGLGG